MKYCQFHSKFEIFLLKSALSSYRKLLYIDNFNLILSVFRLHMERLSLLAVKLIAQYNKIPETTPQINYQLKKIFDDSDENSIEESESENDLTNSESNNNI